MATYLYRLAQGSFRQSSKAAIESTLDALKKLPGVTSVTDPYQTNQVAPNGSLALAT
ncbi:hypothetical protein ABZ260_12650 [Streptosporangium sp. NPDC006013]|uniref:hypothetical protein n=1 Tax=Streptosporangium sp. NPDC006013 TaxID=3155596 RepID=UPI0033A9CD7D